MQKIVALALVAFSVVAVNAGEKGKAQQAAPAPAKAQAPAKGQDGKAQAPAKGSEVVVVKEKQGILSRLRSRKAAAAACNCQ